MNILSAQGLSKSFGLKQLFDNISFGIDERDRIGIIGVNGSGKSTLLRILARQEPHDEGTLAQRQDLRVEYLPQTPEFNSDHSVIEHIFASQNEISGLVRDYEMICHQIAHAPGDEALLKRFNELTGRMEAASAWEYETRAKTILTRLGIEDFDARIGTLSGGYRKRVALAHALLADPDLLILDEPTNHLDADTVAWLEDYLRRFNGAVIIVTHDRYFLDRVTKRIIEIDQGDLRFFDGNFSYYLEKKAEIEESLASAENRRRTILKKELEWFRRGARARRTKEKARIHHMEDLQSVSFTRSREEIKFDTLTRRMGKKIVEIEAVSKSFGDKKIVNQFTYIFTRGERLGIIGANGSGKTTLVNLITGRLAPDSGKIEVGETVSFGYYDQESQGFDLNERAIDYVKREGGEMLRTTDGSALTAMLFMERFQFTPQMMYAPVGKLSGGERRRLYLVRTLMRDPNFLILDEPANDLDIMTLEALEDFLDGFAGCVVVISHDRYFLDRVVDHVVAFEGEGKLKLYPGGYTVYAEMRAEAREEAKALAAAKNAAPGRQPASSAPDGGKRESAAASAPKKLSYKEQRELEALEAEIPSLETRLEELGQAINGAAADYQKLKALSEEQAALTARLEAAMTRWEELAARAG